MRKFVPAAAAAIVVHLCGEASAATAAAEGFVYVREVLEEFTEGCVTQGPGGVFVGVGPTLSFPPPGGTRDIVFVADGGATRTVATGLNSISDCVYDGASGTLYVTDSGGDFAGATTGDTVFAIPGDSMAVAVEGLEVLPEGTLPFAFGIDLLGDRLVVTEATGNGLGTVVTIDLSVLPVVASPFLDGFDYTGGVTVDGERVLVAEALQPSFQSVLYSFAPDGTPLATLSGPTYAHGSVDLDVALDGRVLVTGASTLVAVEAGGATTPLVTGLDGGSGFAAFGGGLSVHPFTGRIDFAASSFTGADDDRSLHRLVPVGELLPGGGASASDCAMELYGVRLVAPAEGKPAKSAICVDGAACDADGVADGACTFPIGLCLAVSDARLADCGVDGVASVEVLAAKPAGASLVALVDGLSSAMPVTDPSCFFGEGMRVPVKTTRNGAKEGKGLLKLRATTTDARPLKDTDVVKLVCRPAP